ncbi:hypothetical protein EJ110_NYTH59770 [Nymphaea thermarum]|nr:hypothetical protein EJ110_NYTH59770 [Nymphaea thermarum]
MAWTLPGMRVPVGVGEGFAPRPGGERTPSLRYLCSQKHPARDTGSRRPSRPLEAHQVSSIRRLSSRRTSSYDTESPQVDAEDVPQVDTEDVPQVQTEKVQIASNEFHGSKVPNSTCLKDQSAVDGTRRCKCNGVLQWVPKTGTCIKGLATTIALSLVLIAFRIHTRKKLAKEALVMLRKEREQILSTNSGERSSKLFSGEVYKGLLGPKPEPKN